MQEIKFSVSTSLKPILLLQVLTLCFHLCSGQVRSTYSSDELFCGLLKSNTLGSVLYVAAHPDDENTRLLSYLARERNFRTGYLSITRGDGGQNLIGKEQGDLLGLIRTQELIAARKVDGAEQFFTRACDFGYSKNPDETFEIWNKDSILSDVVFVIRKFRPDVIICRFPTTGEGGHGHHTASAILAEEAFDAAGDPNRFSWQLAYAGTWQPKRLFWNTFNFGSTNTTAPDQLKLDVGVFNPLIGKSHGEIAAESRSNHKSQGFGSAAIRGASIEYFKQLKGDAVKEDIFEGINTSWSRLSGTSALQKKIENVTKEFDHTAPDKSVMGLIAIRKDILALDASDPSTAYWKRIKLEENSHIIIRCSGIWFEATLPDPVVTAGKKAKLKIQVVNRNGISVKATHINYPDVDSTMDVKLQKNELLTWTHDFSVSGEVKSSTPYWLKNAHSTGQFVLDDLVQVGNAENNAVYEAKLTLDIASTSLDISTPVVNKFTDPIRGEVYRPIEVLPAVTLSTDEQIASFFNDRERSILLTLRANQDSIKGKLVVNHSGDWTSSLTDSLLAFDKKGDEIRMKITIRPGTDKESRISFSFVTESGICNQSIKRIKYDHIPEQFYLRNAILLCQKLELKGSGGKIGYVEGAGDAVAACLTQAGYQVTILDEEALQAGDLASFSAIVTGVRAFNTEQNLIRFKSTLLDYVKDGGNLVVQYNTNNRLGPAPEKIGPYPFTISNQRVTDERSPVRLVVPEHPALNSPNRISLADFDGWIQERGIYFAASVDSQYVQPIALNDPKEKENTGSLIIAPYGKGNFVYTGLAFFRELPQGVSGAYKLFVNLMELPKRP